YVPAIVLVPLSDTAMAHTARTVRASASALRARTPNVSKDGANGLTPASEIKPCDGRKPQIPQLLAGIRLEPAVSVPSAKSTSPHATAEADPLDEPPGTRSGARGLRGVPSK